jgi:dolichol-phosphate mannosyltransferase
MSPRVRIDSVAIVLPAFNEEKDLPALLLRLRENLAAKPFRYEVVVVDDGSSDRTAELAQEASTLMPLRLIQHKVNEGIGAAMQSGLSAAVDTAEAVVVMDADNTHDPFNIQAMVAELEKGEAHVVIASRFQKGSVVMGVPHYRRLLGWASSQAMRFLAPFPYVSDYSTGFRAYRSSILRRLALVRGRDKMVEKRGFESRLELLLKLRDVGACAAEIPGTYRYDLKSGTSKFPLCRTFVNGFTLARRAGSSPSDLQLSAAQWSQSVTGGRLRTNVEASSAATSW